MDFIGTHTWEEICRDWLLRAGAEGRLPFLPDQVGSAWTRTAQVDVVGINRMDKTLVLGECKWGRRACDQDMLEKLAGQAAEFVPQEGQWRVLFIGFSRSGWTDGAHQFARDFAKQAPQEHLRIIGMELLDLKRIDDDLAAWKS